MRKLSLIAAISISVSAWPAAAQGCTALAAIENENVAWLVADQGPGNRQGGYVDTQDAAPAGGSRVFEQDIEHHGNIVRSIYMFDGVDPGTFVEYGWHMESNDEAWLFRAWQDGLPDSYHGPDHIEEITVGNPMSAKIGVAMSWGSGNDAPSGRWNLYLGGTYKADMDPADDLPDFPVFTDGYFVTAIERNNSCDDPYATMADLHYRKAGPRPGKYGAFTNPQLAPQVPVSDTGSKCVVITDLKWQTRELTYTGGSPCLQHVDTPDTQQSVEVDGTWEVS